MSNTTDEDAFELSATRRTLPIALLRARELLMERFRPILSERGITEQQWRVMRVLHETGEADASEIAEKACILAPSLSRILKTLEAKGLITLHRDPEDGRRTLSRPTEASAALIREITPESVDIYADVEAKFGREKLARLLDDLDALVGALEDRG
ncbi:homoprotocatechuate degradation operon regulator HpaR [Roseobacter sp. HKCCA0434]|uniref:homoprotocatechuate degradation operon regulator HpaR n=1 Tax=Roseobacter sp. HKCCA0434 TaxID=3079297 RepID=UPI002905D037|nr:homoprotocatechuate degradation operon regulator HpaR [Roseobacter sp. HKCCA0434]